MTTRPVLSFRANLLCWVAVAIGVILRFWAIGKDIPFGVGVDEPAIMDHAVQMVKTGSLNPGGFYDYGTLSMYIQVAVVIVRYLAGTVSGMWSTLGQTSSADYYLWGREVGALFGVATIAVVYRIAARWGELTAVIAAVIMAVQPWHVLSSHMVLTDVPLTFFVASTMLASLRASEERTLTWIAVAAACAGLAAATKYNGVLALAMPVTVAVLWPGRRWQALAVAGGASAVAYLAGAPYTLLALPAFLDSFGELARHFNSTNSSAVAVYLKHFRMAFMVGGREWYGAGGGLSVGGVLSALGGWLLLYAAGIGVLIAVWRAVGRAMLTGALGFVVFGLLYFRMITNQSGQIFARYAMPLLPLIALGLALSASLATSAIVRRLRPGRGRALASAALLALVVAPPLYQSMEWDRNWAKVSSIRQTHDWMLSHVKPDERVVVEDFFLRPSPPRFKSVDNVLRLIDKTLDQYRAEGVVYLIAESLEYQKYINNPKDRPVQYAAYQTLFNGTEEVARFESGPDNSPGSTFRVLRIPR